jgi:hypothetical protein
VDNKEELQNLIADLRNKFPDNVHVGLISDDDLARETQSRPGQALSDETAAEISRAAEAMARAIFGDAAIIESRATQISPMDGSEESRQAVISMLKNMIPRRLHCYHYILDSNGQPVHSDDEEEVFQFQRDKKDILATQSFDCLGMEMRLTTRLLVHNPMKGNEIPKPRWITELRRMDTGECGFREFAQSVDEAWTQHRVACEEARRILAKESAEGEVGNE